MTKGKIAIVKQAATATAIVLLLGCPADRSKGYSATLILVTLEFDTPPERDYIAELYLDGARVTTVKNRSRMTKPIPHGKHKIAVKVDGYHPSEREVEIVEVDFSQDFTFKMKKE